MDKILTEAFDKLKAIEESDDPFCIGELSENEEDIAEEEEIVEEGNEDHDDNDFDPGMVSGHPGYDHHQEERVIEFGTDSGDHYVIEFQSDGENGDRGYVEANGISVGSFTVGGAGSMNARIQKPDAVIDMLVAAMQIANGTGM